MSFELKITAETWDEFQQKLNRLSAQHSALDDLPLQEILLYADKRATAEGYDLEITKAGSKSLSPAEQRKEQARAKLREDLEGSLKEETKEEVPEETAPEVPETTPKIKAKKTNGHDAKIDPEQLKQKCILQLRDLFGSHKAQVMEILAQHGGGLKNFGSVPAEKFPAIAKAIEALEEKA